MQCVNQVVHNPFFLFPVVLLILAGTFSITTFLLYKKRIIRTVLHFLIFLTLYTPLLLIQGFALFIVMIFIVDPWDDSRASTYFPLHAAIKNTCILDKAQVNCPRTVEELIYIEPERFKKLLEGKEVKYQYTNNQNYSLLIKADSGHVVIFDPRFTGYASNSYMGDFFETRINACAGDNKLRDNPPISGIWDQL